MSNLLTPSLQSAKSWLQPARGEVVGIDVGMHGLTTVHVSKSKKGYRWHSRGLSQFATTLVDEEPSGYSSVTPSQMRQWIEEVMPRTLLGPRRQSVAVLPPAAAVLRWPTDSNDPSLLASIRSDLGAMLTPGDSVESCSWQIGVANRHMFYSVSGGLSAAVAEGISRSGYRVPRIDARPHVMARALALHASEAFTLIEWGWSDCTIMFASRPPEIVGGGASGKKHRKTVWPKPLLCRTLRGYSLSSAIKMVGQVSKDADVTVGNGSPQRRTADQSCETLRPLVHAATEEIQRTLRYAQTLDGADVSGPIVICGLAGSTPVVAQLLAESLGRPVERWRWNGCQRPPDHSSAPDDSLFAVALAAACGEL